MIKDLSNLLRLWTGQPITNKRPSVLFCMLGIFLQCYFSSFGIFLCGFLILTLTLGRLKGYGVALTWGFLPSAISSAATMDLSDRHVDLAIYFTANLLLVCVSQMRTGQRQRFADSGRAAQMNDDALRAGRRQSMAEPAKFKMGPVLGHLGDVSIPQFIEDETGQRYVFLRVEPGPIACIQDGEVIIAPGFVFGIETKN